MNFNLVEIYNGLLRFNKHILNELAEGLKHLPNLDGVSKGDSLIINEQGNPAWGSAVFIPTFENGFIPPLDGSDGDVGVRVPEFYICVKDTGTKYQLWISDFNIDGTFTRVHPFIISHTKTMTRTRKDGKEEVFSACIKPDDTRYLGGNKSSSVAATKLQGRPRTGISYEKANEFCANRGDWITMIDYLEYCALQALCYIEYANFDNQATLNVNLTSDGFKQGGLGAGVTNLNLDRWIAFNGNNPIVQTYWTAEHNIGNGSTNGDQANTNNYITEFDFRFGPYFIPNKVGTNKKADYNWIKGNNGQDTDKAVRVLTLGDGASYGSNAGSGRFDSDWVRSTSNALIGFFTTVKLD